MNLRTSRLYPALATAATVFIDSPAIANTSPSEIQTAVDAVFGPWETVNVGARANVYDKVWRKDTSLALDGVDAAIALLDIDGNPSWDPGSLSWVTLKATVTGPTTLRFSYFSANVGHNKPWVSIDDTFGTELPLLGRWGEGSVVVPDGTHLVTWRFNGYIPSHGLDQVWIDDDPRPRLLGVDAYAWREGDPVTVDLATNKPCFAFSAAGLPPGVAIDESAGRLTGTPSAAGSFLARITARNEAGPHTKEYLIRVAPALPPSPDELIPLATALDFSPWEILPRSGTVDLGGPAAGAVQPPWSGAVTALARDGTDAAVVVLTHYTPHLSSPRAFSTKLRTVIEGPGVFSVWHRAVIPPPLPGLTTVPIVIFDHWINDVYLGSNSSPNNPETPVITGTWVERKFTLPAGRHAIDLAAQAVVGVGHFTWFLQNEPTTVLFDQASFQPQPISRTFRQWLGELAQPGAHDDPIPSAVLTQDDEADGMGLLMEYALGGSPAFPDTHRLPETSVVDGHLTLTVLKAPGTSGLEYTVQTNTSLAGNGWTTFGTEVMNEDATRLVVRCRQSVSEQPACYFRLRVRLDDAGNF